MAFLFKEYHRTYTDLNTNLGQSPDLNRTSTFHPIYACQYTRQSKKQQSLCFVLANLSHMTCTVSCTWKMEHCATSRRFFVRFLNTAKTVPNSDKSDHPIYPFVQTTCSIQQIRCK